MPPLLTKSKFINGTQCLRYLWVACNEPKRIPATDSATQRRFDQGHLVGELAQKLFPGGEKVPFDSFMGNISLTKKFMKNRQPLFEAGVLAGRLYSRLDILNPVENDEWDIIEVKSSTSVKDIYVIDAAYQQLCCETSGLKIRKCYLARINNQYVKNGDIQPQELFAINDITDDVFTASFGIKEKAEELLRAIDNRQCPQVGIGPHCSSPYDCPLMDECWAGITEHSVFTLTYAGKKAFDLYERGIVDITSIPSSYQLNAKQQIQFESLRSGKAYTDTAALREFLANLTYPLHFFDFETFDAAVPFYDGTRPYQKIPFQFSLHIQEKPGGPLQHFWHLAEGQQDPRPGVLEKIKSSFKPHGSVVTYNQSFEQKMLESLGEAFPEYAPVTSAIIERLVDLIIPFRNFHYYNPSQKGSASIKKVLPAITGHSYQGMEIGEGGDASLRFLDITFGDADAEERSKVRNALLEYCGLDTEGMVWIIEELRKITGVSKTTN